MLNLDTSRPLLRQAKPLLDTLSSVRPLIMLPFNIWLYFVTLPFRALFFFFSLNGSARKEKVEEVKEKVMEIKEEVVKAIPEQLTMRTSRPLEVVDDTLSGFDWYPKAKEQLKEKLSEMKEEKKETKAAEPEKAFTINPIDQLKEKLAESMSKVTASEQENVRLHRELDELKSKFDSDEKTLKTFRQEEDRLKQVISVEQRKCFDLTQNSLSLKQQISKLENEKSALMSASVQKPAEKPAEEPAEKPAKLGAKKSKKSKTVEPAVKPVEKIEAEPEKEDPLTNPHGWKKSADAGSHFTEMCAEAQKEEREHGKTFVEVVKDSTTPAPAPVETKAEFLVVGGDHSMHHETLPISAK